MRMFQIDLLLPYSTYYVSSQTSGYQIVYKHAQYFHFMSMQEKIYNLQNCNTTLVFSN